MTAFILDTVLLVSVITLSGDLIYLHSIGSWTDPILFIEQTELVVLFLLGILARSKK